MDAALPARLPLEMLYHVGDVNLITINAGLFQRAIEHCPGGTDKRSSGEVFFVPWLLTHQHYSCRRRAFAGFTVDDALMEGAAPDAVFLHCLPAHRGEEVSASVLEGPRSLVWQQAENRLHAQRGLLSWLLRGV